MLSNTIWPRAWHRGFFERDGVAHLIDGDVYTSEIPWTKPSPRAFRAAMDAVGVTDPARCVYVGDRLFDDVWGAHNAGLRAIHIPLSSIPAAQIGHTEGRTGRGRPRAVGHPRAAREPARLTHGQPVPQMRRCARCEGSSNEDLGAAGADGTVARQDL